MVFETVEALRHALNAADTAIRQAVQNGNIIDVVQGLKAELTKIYQTDQAGLFSAECRRPRFMHECCNAFVVATRDKALNQAFADRQVQALAEFDKRNNIGSNALTPVASGSNVGTGEVRVPRKAPVTYKSGPVTRPVPTPLAPVTAAPIAPFPASPSVPSPPAPMAVSAVAPGVAPTTHIPPGPVASGSKIVVGAANGGGHWQRRNPTRVPMGTRPTARQSAAPRPVQHGPPTEQMEKLGLGARDGGEPSTRRFSSLDREMDVDEDDWERRAEKRKQDEEASGEEYVGKGDDDDDEYDDDDDEVKEIKPPINSGAGKGKAMTKRPRAPPVAIDRYHLPACNRCQKTGRHCQAQLYASACYMCAKHKVKCEGAGKAQGANMVARQADAPTSSKKRKIVDDRTSDIEEIPPPPREPRSAPKKSAHTRPSKKGKGKATEADMRRWQEESSDVPIGIANFEDRFVAMEKEIRRLRKMESKVGQYEARFGGIDEAIKKWDAKFRKIDDALGWQEDKINETEDRTLEFLDKLDNHQGDLRMRLEGLEDYFGMPRNGRQGVTLYDGDDACYVVHSGNRAAHIAAIAAQRGLSLQSLPAGGAVATTQHAGSVSAHRPSATVSTSAPPVVLTMTTGRVSTSGRNESSASATAFISAQPVASTSAQPVVSTSAPPVSASAPEVASAWATSHVPAPVSTIQLPPQLTLTPPTPQSSQGDHLPPPHAPLTLAAAPALSPLIPTNVPERSSPQLHSTAVGTSDAQPISCIIPTLPTTQSPPRTFSPLSSSYLEVMTLNSEPAHAPTSAPSSAHNESAVRTTTNASLNPQPPLPPSPPWRSVSTLPGNVASAMPSGTSDITVPDDNHSPGLLMPPARARSRSRSRGPPTRRSPRLGSPMPTGENPLDVEGMNVDK